MQGHDVVRRRAYVEGEAMGIKEWSAKVAEEEKERRSVEKVAREQADTAKATVVGVCPSPKEHYVTEVNKGSIRMQTWQAALNSRFQSGYRLVHVFEQGGNTVQVFEHHFHP